MKSCEFNKSFDFDFANSKSLPVVQFNFKLNLHLRLCVCVFISNCVCIIEHKSLHNSLNIFYFVLFFPGNMLFVPPTSKLQICKLLSMFLPPVVFLYLISISTRLFLVDFIWFHPIDAATKPTTRHHFANRLNNRLCSSF